jgi:hypothetical protein
MERRETLRGRFHADPLPRPLVVPHFYTTSGHPAARNEQAITLRDSIIVVDCARSLDSLRPNAPSEKYFHAARAGGERKVGSRKGVARFSRRETAKHASRSRSIDPHYTQPVRASGAVGGGGPWLFTARARARAPNLGRRKREDGKRTIYR